MRSLSIAWACIASSASYALLRSDTALSIPQRKDFLISRKPVLSPQ
jgi:hypothetical protein